MHTPTVPERAHTHLRRYANGSAHPGGSSIFAQYCGQDATEARTHTGAHTHAHTHTRTHTLTLVH